MGSREQEPLETKHQPHFWYQCKILRLPGSAATQPHTLLTDHRPCGCPRCRSERQRSKQPVIFRLSAGLHRPGRVVCTGLALSGTLWGRPPPPNSSPSRTRGSFGRRLHSTAGSAANEQSSSELLERRAPAAANPHQRDSAVRHQPRRAGGPPYRPAVWVQGPGDLVADRCPNSWWNSNRKPPETLAPVACSGSCAQPLSLQAPRTLKVRPDRGHMPAVRLDAVRLDHVRLDAVRLDVVRSDAVCSNHVRSDAVRLDHVRLDHVCLEVFRLDHVRLDHVRSEVVCLDHVRLNAVRSVVRSDAAALEGFY